MSGDEYDILSDKFLGDTYSFPGIALIVTNDQPHLLAEDATFDVHIVRGKLHAASELLAESSEVTAHWAGHADDYLIAYDLLLPGRRGTARRAP